MADLPYTGSPQTPKKPGSLTDDFAVDRTPKVTIEVTSKDSSGKQVKYTILEIKEYSYDSDILTITDPFACTVGNPEGRYIGKISPGDLVTYYMSDPDVSAGVNTPKIKGVITGISSTSDAHSGTQIMLTGADLGWFIENCPGPLWQRYRGKSFNQILSLVLDKTWGFTGVRPGNDFNRRVKLGRAGLGLDKVPPLTNPPPIQFEPGQPISDVLVTLARRDKLLVNVSADGYLQFFQPNYNQEALYRFDFHKTSESLRYFNNVESVKLTQKLDGVYTDVICIGQVAYPPFGGTSGNVNEGKIRGRYKPATNPLMFNRTHSFSDAEQMSKTNSDLRAQWKWQRGAFDSWVYEITVKGHSQKGHFFESDTMCEVNDTVTGVVGTYYVSAVRYNRSMSKGTTTTLTIRKPGLLGA